MTMKKQYLLGFLLLLTSTIGMLPGGVFAIEVLDTDGDGVPDNVDQCPHLLEDYDPHMVTILTVALQILFHGMMQIMMAFKIILMTVLL